MQLSIIQQQIYSLNPVQQAQIKGGTDNDPNASSVIIEDVDVI